MALIFPFRLLQQPELLLSAASGGSSVKRPQRSVWVS